MRLCPNGGQSLPPRAFCSGTPAERALEGSAARNFQKIYCGGIDRGWHSAPRSVRGAGSRGTAIVYVSA